MGKEDKKQAELDHAEEAPKAAPTIAEMQAELDHAASFSVLVSGGKDALAKIKAGWAQVLDGIAECEALQQSQRVAHKAAHEHAAKNGTTSHAVVLDHNPLIAHSWEAVASLPAPVVATPEGYVRTFASEADRMASTQALLNQGSTLVAPHADRKEVHDALLHGVKPSDIQSARTPIAELNARAKSWFGYRSNS
jgi:hypothetical protein